jgi:hypothetical protein
MNAFNRTNGLPKSNDDLVWLNYGINPTNPTHNRDGGPVGASETMALQMAVDGTLIVPNVLPVMGGAWGRRVADLGYSGRTVSRDGTQAGKAWDIPRGESLKANAKVPQNEVHTGTAVGQWRAYCVERRTVGSGRGGWKRTAMEPQRAGRLLYTFHPCAIEASVDQNTLCGHHAMDDRSGRRLLTTSS